ncbi:MAG: hypothetical protein IJF60_02405 [Agathobacter sp.]|nr:hypothetical protein [Agathobacter sp.]
MEKRKIDMIYSLIVGTFVLGLSIICWLKPADDISATERRELTQFPKVSAETILDGSFMEKFETYALDQFPMRETFRSVKANIQKYVLGQSDNKGIYLAEGHLSQMDASISDVAIERSVNKLSSVYNTYLKDTDTNVYLSIIPDKNYFLAKENGYLVYDYGELYDKVTDELSQMSYIEIRDLLAIEDYYRTDTHWKQECIVDVAEYLVDSMVTGHNNSKSDYEMITLETPFYGVYYGQAALSVEPDTLTYLNSDVLENCLVYDHENQRGIPVYDLNKAIGRDGYEMYLSGSLSVITVENPNASTDKELVLFRDSFGSSIAPLMVEDYAKITLLDIRYLNENMIGEFVEFDSQDVLFLYSTSVLNNESSFR